ncbi:hypothetical protein AG4045_023470, partial [Apium graveolens]
NIRDKSIKLKDDVEDAAINIYAMSREPLDNKSQYSIWGVSYCGVILELSV